MKNTDRIYSFFIVIALLFWNPFSFYLMYGRKPVYQITVVHLFYLMVLLAGLSSIWMISRKRLGGRFKNLTLFFTFTAILFATMVLLNSAIGRMKRAKNKTQVAASFDDRGSGLVFVPNSRARYKTTEFDFDANISSIGLRNREVTKDKGDKFRILCFGDSWTFGWGVNEEFSWPRRLEEYLHKAGMANAEVINCGRGGQYTTMYKQYMADAVPMLKPDLVLVGVLEEDDLAQLFEMNYTVKDSGQAVESIVVKQDAVSAVQEYISCSLGNIIGLFKKEVKTNDTIDISVAWEKSAHEMLDKYDHILRYRFHTMPDTIRQMFLSGNLNPNLVSTYLKFPDRVTIFNNPENMATQYAITEMDKDVKDMKTVCAENGARMVFVNLPINFFNGHKVIRCPNDVLNPYFEENNKIDSIYAGIASENGLPYMQLTERFRSLTDKDGYYYRFDGHPNKHGYLEIANYIGQQLIEQNHLKGK